jgi:hypothetical protein
MSEPCDSRNRKQASNNAGGGNNTIFAKTNTTDEALALTSMPGI